MEEIINSFGAKEEDAISDFYKILSPQSLVEEIKQDIKNVANNYDI